MSFLPIGRDECFMSRVLIAIGFLVVYPLLLAQQTLNDDSVIKLMKAGVSEDVIISTINRSPGSYDTSVDGLIAMKNAGMTNTGDLGDRSQGFCGSADLRCAACAGCGGRAYSSNRRSRFRAVGEQAPRAFAFTKPW